MSNELRDKLVERENSLKDQMTGMVERAEAEGRDLKDAEKSLRDDLRAQVEGIREKIAVLDEATHREDQHVQAVAPIVHAVSQTEDRLHRTNGEENVYNPRNANLRLDEGGRSFLADIISSQSGGPDAYEASERLARHKAQMKHRGVNFDPSAPMPAIRVGTANLGGTVPPQVPPGGGQRGGPVDAPDGERDWHPCPSAHRHDAAHPSGDHRQQCRRHRRGHRRRQHRPSGHRPGDQRQDHPRLGDHLRRGFDARRGWWTTC